MLDIRNVDPTIFIDIRYATANNFTKEKVYSLLAPLLIEEAAYALSRVQKNFSLAD